MGKNCVVAPFAEPVGNRASVRYRKTADAQIMITGLDGFLSEKEIREEYGSEVARIYTSGPHMSRLEADGEIWISRGENPVLGTYAPDAFQALIAAMKKYGARLHQIIQDVRAAEELPEKTIFI